MRKYLALLVSALLSACAMQPHKILPATTVTSTYQNVDCATLRRDRTQELDALLTLDTRQKNAANTDTALFWVGTLVFWPAYFGMFATENHADEIARLKGEQQAMTTVIDERCSDASTQAGNSPTP